MTDTNEQARALAKNPTIPAGARRIIKMKRGYRCSRLMELIREHRAHETIASDFIKAWNKAGKRETKNYWRAVHDQTRHRDTADFLEALHEGMDPTLDYEELG